LIYERWKKDDFTKTQLWNPNLESTRLTIQDFRTPIGQVNMGKFSIIHQGYRRTSRIVLFYLKFSHITNTNPSIVEDCEMLLAHCRLIPVIKSQKREKNEGKTCIINSPLIAQ
jgi:hypothetical protein